MCGPLQAKEPAWTVISLRQAKAVAGGHQAVAAAKAHLTNRSSRSKDGWGWGWGGWGQARALPSWWATYRAKAQPKQS